MSEVGGVNWDECGSGRKTAVSRTTNATLDERHHGMEDLDLYPYLVGTLDK